MDINPALKPQVEEFYPRACLEIVSEEFDYVLDCIDSINSTIIAAKKEKSEDHKQYGSRWKDGSFKSESS
jgi:tRNA A37 threonylcarbamoyladenosine dehydratase